ncbi:hypothetical protein [Phenylobacterium immobile]|uniref:hypothetical protein n=1 Tax=Phenylobacterium immobile TaxID=21 RepID=UPI000ABA28DD|nr:hypothetical protein [Phenylobacterium immobile]
MASTAYSHQTVALDGQTFVDCEFNACRLVYAGGEPPRFDGCRFDDCDWRLEGAASDTLAYLKVMWAAGAKTRVQAIIKDVTVLAR